MKKGLNEQRISDFTDYFGEQQKDLFENVTSNRLITGLETIVTAIPLPSNNRNAVFWMQNANLRYETPVLYPETDDLLKLLQLFKSKLLEQQRTIKISNLCNGRGIKSRGKYVQ